MELDLGRLLAVLHRHGVEYVLIGGMAALYHGSPFPTEDADITPRATTVNAERLSAALTDLNARIRTDAAPEGLPFSHDGASLLDASVWNLTTDAGDLDISFRPSGTDGFGDLARDAESTVLFDIPVEVASLADIVRSKQAANRPKDQRVLPTLREILSRRNDG